MPSTPDRRLTDATRIKSDPGESSAAIHDNLAERATAFYVLAAQQGQIMAVEISSPTGDVRLSVVGEDGTPLKRYQNGPSSWKSQLPATQDYLIHAVSVGPATDYTLRVWVEPVGESGAESVAFAPGETSASRSGALPTGGVKEYVLAIEDPLGFSMIPEMREVEGGYAISAQFTRPASDVYWVTLNKGDHSPSTNYSVDFTVE